MKKGILLVGEPMGLFIAQTEGPLEQVEQYRMAVAGAEYNVAVGMSRLGHHAGYVTSLGNDPFGKRIVWGMEQNQIDTAHVSWSDSRPTGFMMKSKVKHGDPRVAYFRKGSAASALNVEAVDALDLTPYSHLHMTGILPALSSDCLAASRRLMARARAEGLFVSFDPNLRPALWSSVSIMAETLNELMTAAHLVLPGIGEGELLTGTRDPQQIAAFYLAHGVSMVVIKLGPEGAMLFEDGRTVTVAGYPVPEVVDTVGAGDGFAVGVISGLMEGLDPVQAVRRGNAIGAIQVMSIGDNDGLPTRSQLESYMVTGKKGW